MADELLDLPLGDFLDASWRARSRRAEARQRRSSSRWRPASSRWSRARRRTTGRRPAARSARPRRSGLALRHSPRPTPTSTSDALSDPPPARGGRRSGTATRRCGTRSRRPPRSRSRSPRRAATWPAWPHCSSRTETRRSVPMPRSPAFSPREGRRAAAMLVETNLGATEDDPRVRHVRTLVAAAAEASERALAAAE